MEQMVAMESTELMENLEYHDSSTLRLVSMVNAPMLLSSKWAIIPQVEL